MSVDENLSALNKPIRKGLRDIWNAFMTDGAHYTIHDIPYCPSTAPNPPISLIGYDETNHAEHTESFVHFYMDD